MSLLLKRLKLFSNDLTMLNRGSSGVVTSTTSSLRILSKNTLHRHHHDHSCYYYSTTTLLQQQQQNKESTLRDLIVKTEQHPNGLMTITMDDKKTRNSLSLKMMEQLIDAIKTGSNDSTVRSIVIRNTREASVFSSGHNLKELSVDHKGVPFQKHVFSTCTDLMMAIRNAPVPVFAAVNGLAAAAGCQLVAACDFAICTKASSFSTPGASFGLFCSTPAIPLSRKVPGSLAAYMVLTGNAISSEVALNSGLVVGVVSDFDELDSTVATIHSSISSKSRSVLKLGKQFFYEQLSNNNKLSYEATLRSGEDVMVRNLQLEDGVEGIRSFKEKRKPVWGHRD